MNRALAVLILLAQVVGSVMPGGAVVCLNPEMCGRGSIPVAIEVEEERCACCERCAGEREEGPTEPSGFSTPCTCCIGVPVMPLMIRVDVERQAAELERVLSLDAGGSALPGGVFADDWMLHRGWQALSGRPPDRVESGAVARARACGIGTTRMII